MIMVKLSRRVL